MTILADPPPPAEVPPEGDAPIADTDAEQAVLGAVLISRNARDEVEHRLAGRDFYRPAHELIWAAAMRLHGKGEPADMVTVSGELAARGEIVRIGGPAYLHTLTQAVPTAANVGYYARIVAERAVQRRLDLAAMQLSQLARSRTPIEELTAAAAKMIDAASVASSTDLGRDMAPGWDDWIDQLGEPLPPQQAGILWGWRDADMGTGNGQRVLLPMQDGELILIGARPTTGKSLIAQQIAAHALQQNKRVLIVTMEMSEAEVRERLVACAAKVLLSRIQNHTLTEDDWHRVSRFRDWFDTPGLVILDDQHVTLARIRAAVRKHKPHLVVIDHTGLIELPPHRPAETRHVLEDLTRGLKQLASDEVCTVLACQQLNRAAESRVDKRPMMSDLRETGTWEQDASRVLLLHRPDMYEQETPRAGELDLIVAKQRNGEAGFTISLAFQGAIARAADLAWQ